MITRSGRSLALLTLLAGCCLTAAAAATPKRPPSELSNSFIITQLQDLQPSSIRGATLTPCEYAVQRAKGIGQKHFSLVVTAYWKGDKNHVKAYAFKDVSPRYAEGVGYPEPTPENVQAWKYGLQRCFASAVDAGFKGLQILNHIDHASESPAWRNFLDFDPLAKYNGWTYEDVVVRPVAEALKSVVKKDTKVWFMVSGEMGRSIFAHPLSYLKLISKYRGSLSERKAKGTLKIGVALHWNKVCGDCFAMPYTDSQPKYNTTYHQIFSSRRDQILAAFDVPMIKRVFEVSDVLGISHYAPAPESGVNQGTFNVPIDTTVYELAHWGIDLKGLINSKRDFLFSEVGLGGGDPNNQRIASNLRELATNIHNGIWTVYNVVQDPWTRHDYREYRRAWFKALTAFLYNGGSPSYKVDAAFIWSVGTWDVAAIHPISTSQEGTYADWEIVKWMRWLSSQVPV